MYMGIFYMYACTTPGYLVSAEARKKNHWISGTEGIDGCEPSCVCWKLNMGSLEEQLTFFKF